MCCSIMNIIIDYFSSSTCSICNCLWSTLLNDLINPRHYLAFWYVSNAVLQFEKIQFKPLELQLFNGREHACLKQWYQRKTERCWMLNITPLHIVHIQTSTDGREQNSSERSFKLAVIPGTRQEEKCIILYDDRFLQKKWTGISEESLSNKISQLTTRTLFQFFTVLRSGCVTVSTRGIRACSCSWHYGMP